MHVSLYKSLLGTRGAVLAADAATVATARTWRQRLGGGIRDAWPLALSALVGLDMIAERMPTYREHAIAIAAAVNADGACHLWQAGRVPVVTPLPGVRHHRRQDLNRARRRRPQSFRLRVR